MNPRTSSLFHFTKSIDALTSILINGLEPHYCQEDMQLLGFQDVEFPMVCFCDIPISRISEHTSSYGEYGLGLTREWGIKNGLAPVIYATEESVVVRLAKYLYKPALTKPGALETELESALFDHFVRLVATLKPIRGRTVAAGVSTEKDFYQESEWRYVPQDFDVLTKDQPPAKRDDAIKKVTNGRLQFTPQDVKYIFVRSDAEIPGIFDQIQNKMGRFPHDDVKVLATRIVSLETIMMDL